MLRITKTSIWQTKKASRPSWKYRMRTTKQLTRRHQYKEHSHYPYFLAGSRFKCWLWPRTSCGNTLQSPHAFYRHQQKESESIQDKIPRSVSHPFCLSDFSQYFESSYFLYLLSRDTHPHLHLHPLWGGLSLTLWGLSSGYLRIFGRQKNILHSTFLGCINLLQIMQCPARWHPVPWQIENIR